MKAYQRPMAGWWHRNPFYLWYTLREASATVAWHCDGIDDLRAEIAPHGLVLAERDRCVVVRRREG